MHCSACNHERNRAFHWRRVGGFLIRLRECLDCGLVWGTLQREVSRCEECGSDDIVITKVGHNGPDQKIRTHTCRQCGNRQYSIERKIQGEILLETPEQARIRREKRKQMRLF